MYHECGCRVWTKENLLHRSNMTPGIANDDPPFCRGEEATTAIEYAFIASLVAVAGFTALLSLGNTLETMYGVVAGGVSNSVNGGG